LFSAQRCARVDEAEMLRARVPAGSASHLSGKRFAAPMPSVLRSRIEQGTYNGQQLEA
jgi:hypothetical protein